jgi:hypothetical protein
LGVLEPRLRNVVEADLADAAEDHSLHVAPPRLLARSTHPGLRPRNAALTVRDEGEEEQPERQKKRDQAALDQRVAKLLGEATASGHHTF